MKCPLRDIEVRERFERYGYFVVTLECGHYERIPLDDKRDSIPCEQCGDGYDSEYETERHALNLLNFDWSGE